VAIQGQRTAKNLDTLMACADALGEFYKNYVDRVAPYRIGSSAVISGSGMAVEAELYKAYLSSPEIEQGKHQWKKMLQEDKILQNYLLRKNTKIAYAWDAICYDEKVSNADAVETQRSRWLFSYFQNIPNSLGILRRGLFNLSWNQWLFGLVTIAPPMFVMLFAAFGFAVLGLFINPWVSLALVVAVALFIGTIFWTLYLSQAPNQVWIAVAAMPSFVLRQIKGLFKMANPNKNFKHTEHKVSVTIEEVLK
jgi:cellulose synthase/poly-beta-1,6-N-acetylglucosamine synthase-like glycosyltransferase